MRDFEYYAPTRVIFGRGAEARCGALCAEYGAKTVLLHYGGGSAVKSGLIDRVRKNLEDPGLRVVPLGGVRPNPHLALVREGIGLCRREGVDFLLPVGGGSVIDSAKAIAYGLANDGDVWDFFAGTRVPQKAFPLGCVLTLAAAGSEMSNSTVITNQDTGNKRGYRNNLCRPQFAVLNPELTLTVPPYQTACGCADILMHTLERYFTDEADTMQLTDALAEALMRTVLANARVLSREPDNYNARAEVMWAGALSHNDLTQLGNGPGDWAVHQLGHELSARFDWAHGASLTAVWGSWARYVCKQNPARFARLAVNALELPYEKDDETTAEAAIMDLENFFWGLELPTTLEEAGIDAADSRDGTLARELAAACSRGGQRTIGTFKVLNEQDMAEIYQRAAFIND